jgi:hypothetical protein
MLKMDKNSYFVLWFTLTLFFCVFSFMAIDVFIKERINKKFDNTQIVEPFIVLGNDLRGYELRKDSKKYWIFTNEHSNPVIIDVTYKSEF